MVLGSSYSPYGRRLAPPRIPVVIYGTRWCAQSQMVRRYLECRSFRTSMSTSSATPRQSVACNG